MKVGQSFEDRDADWAVRECSTEGPFCVQEEVTGKFGKLQKNELFDLYCSPNVIRDRK